MPIVTTDTDGQDRQAKIAELDAYLAELDDDFGPVQEQELVAARALVDMALNR